MEADEEEPKGAAGWDDDWLRNTGVDDVKRVSAHP